MKNIELKARISDPDQARAVCERIGASFEWRRSQRDIFFRVPPPNRLKLRIEDGEPPYLIRYDRPSAQGGRECSYQLLPIRDTCHESCARFFMSALEVAGEVHKTRELFMWNGIRIHIDEVRGKGSFLEFECPIGPGGEAKARETVAALQREFGITGSDTVGGSYGEMQ